MAVPRSVAVVAVGLLAFVAAGCVPSAPPTTVYDAACAGTLVASTPGFVENPALRELSGLVASRRNAGVWWAHNDSGHPNRVYALGDGGRDLGTFVLQGAVNTDWEDIAVGPGPEPGVSYLYVADSGNFPTHRTTVDVYRVPEPAVSAGGAGGTTQLGGVVKLTYSYPPGTAPDAETLLVDPVTGDLFLVAAKEPFRSRVFQAVGSSLVPVAEVPTPSPSELFTGGDVTPDGAFVALRTDDFLGGNGSVVLYPRPAGAGLAAAFGGTPCFGAVGPEVQGEAVGFTPDGLGYVTASDEVRNPPLHRFHTP